ncbi:MAG: hypothetical protein NTX29_10480 [Actinobacteria bacterium]|nr:hypothetical protein [Actinomycetota bacterium]
MLATGRRFVTPVGAAEALRTDAPTAARKLARANHWALTDQAFRTTVLKTSSRVRSSTARLLDHDYLVGHVAPDALAWGMRTEWRAETRLLFADPARTVVDILDEPRIGAGIRHIAEVLVSYLDEHDPASLVEWGDRLGNHAVFKRLGYLIEALGLDRPALVDACLDRVSSGVALLDPDAPDDGPRTMRWRLRVNTVVGFEGAA